MFINECKTIENANDDDIQAIVMHKPLQRLAAKCVLACMYEKSGVVRKNH